MRRILPHGRDRGVFHFKHRELVRQGEFFAGLFILGFSNGIFGRLAGTIAQETAWSAISSTFGISILVWVACRIEGSLLVCPPASPVNPRRRDRWVRGRRRRARPFRFSELDGPDHPEVATGLNNLALLLSNTNRIAEAEPLYRRALVIFIRLLGLDHPSTVTLLENLTAILVAMAAAKPRPAPPSKRSSAGMR